MNAFARISEKMRALPPVRVLAKAVRFLRASGLRAAFRKAGELRSARKRRPSVSDLAGLKKALRRENAKLGGDWESLAHAKRRLLILAENADTVRPKLNLLRRSGWTCLLFSPENAPDCAFAAVEKPERLPFGRDLVRLFDAVLVCGDVHPALALCDGAARPVCWVKPKNAAAPRFLPDTVTVLSEDDFADSHAKNALAALERECADVPLLPMDAPRLSVIVPSFNGGDAVETLLRRLRDQADVPPIEIIFIDSGSTDRTEALCARYGARFVPIPHGDFSHSYARNLGASLATGEILIFMTQDALPDGAFWASKLTAPLREGKAAAASCREMCPPDTDLYYAVTSWNHMRFQGIESRDRLNLPDPTANAAMLRAKAALNDVSNAVRADVFRRFGYRYDYAEDIDLGLRLLWCGYPIALLHEPSTIHGHNREAGYYLKRGYADARTQAHFRTDEKPATAQEILAGRVVFGYSGICTAIRRMRRETVGTAETAAFFAKLDRALRAAARSPEADAAEPDALLAQFVAESRPFADTARHPKFIYAVQYYLSELVAPYCRENGLTTLTEADREQIFGCMLKQFALSVGEMLGELPPDAPWQTVCRNLRTGV